MLLTRLLVALLAALARALILLPSLVVLLPALVLLLVRIVHSYLLQERHCPVGTSVLIGYRSASRTIILMCSSESRQGGN